MVSLYPLHSICGALALVQRWWLWQQTSPSSPPPYSLWPMASPAQKDVWPREVMGPLGGEFGYKGGGGSSCSHRCSPSASSLLRTFTCAPIAPPPKYSFILMEGVGRWSEFFETSLLRDTVAILPALKWYRNSHAHKMLFHVPPSHPCTALPGRAITLPIAVLLALPAFQPSSNCCLNLFQNASAFTHNF